ncbi:hypothetical protein ACI2JA_19755 [Alkalihalobacillus sp. NPDC078783]|uniref:hypothetical protein n=1 Tax=Streptomyces albidoflavus TaxID=1886 RepID=UPI0033F501CB
MNTVISLDGILHLSPVVARGYGLLVGLGIAAVGSALLERHMASNSAVIIAERIAMVTKIALPFLLTGGLVYFVLNNPLL